MIDVPAKGDEPQMKLYRDLSELQAATGEQVTHGWFDPSTNTIVATLESSAHEIGHYMDFKSGRMALSSSTDSPLLRAQKRLRNEIVAILFAAQKISGQKHLLPYERDFLDWFEFMLKRNEFFDQTPMLPFGEWSLKQIQDFAEFSVKDEHPWFERLEYIFRHYLHDVHWPVTYKVRGSRAKSLQGLKKN